MAVRISGRKLLQKKIRELPHEIMVNLRAQLEKSANEIVAMAKRLVPVDKGDLRDSIGWTWGDPPEGSFVFAEAAGPDDARITIYAGSKKAFYVRFQEFGTVGHPATPFFYPSWRALRKKIKSQNTRATKKAIEAVANQGGTED